MVTLEQVRENPEVKAYIRVADDMLKSRGVTEHSFAHVTRTADMAQRLMGEMGGDKRRQELTYMAGYLHDIGNVVNRIHHAQSGAVMAFHILEKMGMEAEEIAAVVAAIGNHDEGTAGVVNDIAAALILADKSDVRRSRVRNRDLASFDIHDRVNHAVTTSTLLFSAKSHDIILDLRIETDLSPIISYFEIFLDRMLLCTKAADFFHRSFGLIVNDQRLL